MLKPKDDTTARDNAFAQVVIDLARVSSSNGVIRAISRDNGMCDLDFVVVVPPSIASRGNWQVKVLMKESEPVACSQVMQVVTRFTLHHCAEKQVPPIFWHDRMGMHMGRWRRLRLDLTPVSQDGKPVEKQYHIR